MKEPDEQQEEEVPIRKDVVEIEDDHGVDEGLLELFTALEAEAEGML